MMHRVLITGAGGGIGRSLRETLRGVYPVLRVSDRVPLAPARDGEEVDQTDIADMAAVEKMVAGVDGIVHLGGISGENSWEKILEGNIVGLYNVFEAARRAGTKRIVMATSNHAVGFYPRSQTIDHRVVPRPDSRYGVSKAFSEALASLYADKHGIGFLCTRIGNFGTKPIDSRRLSIWISPRDYTRLVRIGLEHPDIRFEIVYGVSGNQRSWYDNSKPIGSATARRTIASPTPPRSSPPRSVRRRIRSPRAARAAPSAPTNSPPKRRRPNLPLRPRGAERAGVRWGIPERSPISPPHPPTAPPWAPPSPP
jgi:uronate dehydrogenase